MNALNEVKNIILFIDMNYNHKYVQGVADKLWTVDI